MPQCYQTQPLFCRISQFHDDSGPDIFAGSHEITPRPMLAGVSKKGTAKTARRSFIMKNVRMILAAAALGVSAMALPARAADEFKETKMDSIPREAREALQDKTKNKDDVKVFT